MGDQDGSFLGVADNAADIIADGEPCLVVESRKGLIQKKQVRFQGKSTNQCGSLTHASRQLRGAGCLKAS